MDNTTLTYTADGEIKEFYADSIFYTAKLTTNQPLPKGWKIEIKLIKNKKDI